MGKRKGSETVSTQARKREKAKPAPAEVILVRAEDSVLAYVSRVMKPCIPEDKEHKKRLKPNLTKMGCGNLRT
jgi:hypothetical protein